MNVDISAQVAGVVLFAVIVAWLVVFRRVRSGKPILAFEPRRRAPWGIAAVLLSFLLLLFGQAAAADLFGRPAAEESTVNESIRLLSALGVATLAAMVLSAFGISVLCGATPKDLGWSLRHFARDISIGVVAFLILGPLAFAIQAFFVYQLGLDSHHPLIELIEADPSGELFAVVSVVAVLVAPLAEEYFFRVLFQGWLEKHLLTRRGSYLDSPADEPTGEAQPPASVEFSASDDPPNPYQSYVPADDTPSPPQGESEISEPDAGFVPKGVPILSSAALFAAMHWSHGPDPAALFVLAVGLGYVYQRTHRWLPCVVTHLCLNATTMLMLLAGMN